LHHTSPPPSPFFFFFFPVATGLLSPTEDTLRAVLGDPELLVLLADPAVVAAVADIQSAPDPGSALRAAVATHEAVGARVGALFARLAALAAARCEAVARAEEEEEEVARGGKGGEEGARRAAVAPGIVPLP